ncbi:FAD dependent oxidoreductase superfamily protein [Nannizzia gypsea CBS 118893]|uniref:FAD dependent oxidoreductase superfamily protein n=1 Tax=Arthroderma gypseum (strain ATCC MYA-4604 / CBS 118893) TaxID=535722 RepID=E5R0K7_ARTGP|nr:FAD dependent oxidoreductase superfamily protein [Nannizzia gypsea CBS 118893]EFQ98351.1 FAD dependent oxidoreductase superfamily protein [Nannizzia gypsea CBS 118893]
MKAHGRETIVVIGAGVLGLSSALELIEKPETSKYQIVLVADHFSTDPPNPVYATTNAGAHFRPIPATDTQTERESDHAVRTYSRFKKLAEEEPAFGIEFLEGIEYVSGPATEKYKAMKPNYVNQEGFRLLEGAEKPAGVEFAARYESFIFVEEAFCLDDYNVSLVVNCSGMGFGDPKSFIIRGQTCLISKTAAKTVTQQNADGTWTFLVPRPLNGGTVVGGTKEVGDSNPTASIAVREELLRNAAKMYPDIVNSKGGFDVIKDIVGRRPAREGGMRLEVEILPNKRPVVHAYGIGGRGFETSWGIAEDVHRMVAETLEKRPLASRL